MNRTRGLSAGFMIGVPRMCGDEPAKIWSDAIRKVCSPHVRG